MSSGSCRICQNQEYYDAGNEACALRMDCSESGGISWRNGEAYSTAQECRDTITDCSESGGKYWRNTVAFDVQGECECSAAGGSWIDGQCTFYGCTDSTYYNYNSAANVDDGSCSGFCGDGSCDSGYEDSDSCALDCGLGPVADLTTSSILDTSVSLSWTPSSGTQSQKLQQASPNDGACTGISSWTTVLDDTAGSATWGVAEALTPETAYCFQVESCNSNGCVSSSPVLVSTADGPTACSNQGQYWCTVTPVAGDAYGFCASNEQACQNSQSSQSCVDGGAYGYVRSDAYDGCVASEYESQCRSGNLHWAPATESTPDTCYSSAAEYTCLQDGKYWYNDTCNDSGLQFAKLAVGGSVGCGSTWQGDTYCWGWPGIFQSYPGYASAPVKVAGAETVSFSKLSAGNHTVCGLDPTGAAYCWGSNSYGQLGGASGSGAPSPISGSLRFQDISVGDLHVCGITHNGAAYCWGANDSGQLGDGTTTSRSAPTAVSSGGVSFQQISVGGYSTCAVSTTGAVYCWGSNFGGILGTGSWGGNTQSTPTTVTLSGGPFKQVVLGGTHACALRDDGVAYCWGSDDNGQLGRGSALGGTHAAAPVTGTQTFSQLAAGYSHNCGISAQDNLTYCWGNNNWGELGTDSAIAGTPTVVQNQSMDGFSALSARGYSTCGIGPYGTAFCWGNDSDGKLGIGKRSMSALGVSPDHLIAVSSPTQLSGVEPGAQSSYGAYCTDQSRYFGDGYCYDDLDAFCSGTETTTGDCEPPPPPPTCAPESVGYCTTLEDCDGAGGAWASVDQSCHADMQGACAADNGYYNPQDNGCYASEEDACLNASAGPGHWASIDDSPTCYADEAAFEAACSNAGGSPTSSTTCTTSPIPEIVITNEGIDPSAVPNFTSVSLSASGGSGSGYSFVLTDPSVATLTVTGYDAEFQFNCGTGVGAIAVVQLTDDGGGASTLTLTSSGMGTNQVGNACTDLEPLAYCQSVDPNYGYASEAGCFNDYGDYCTSINALWSNDSQCFSTYSAYACDEFNGIEAANGECLGKGDTGFNEAECRETNGYWVITDTADYIGTCFTTAEDACLNRGALWDTASGQCVASEAQASCLADTTKLWDGDSCEDRSTATLSFTQISAGSYRSCGLAGGKVYCWGSSDGSPGDSVTGVPRLIEVDGELNFSSVVVGGSTSCAITTAGAAWCWGSHPGHGVTSSSSAPVAVSGGITFSSIDPGMYHVCGLDTAGHAWCWGSNWWGEVGSGATLSQQATAPVEVPNFTFTQLSVGSGFSCGLDEEGTAYCWGLGAYGGRGPGASSTGIPTAVQTEQKFKKLSSGINHTCGITLDDRVFCWGANLYGELGDSHSNTSSYTPTEISGNLTFASLSLGLNFSCGITLSGTSYCWGAGAWGQLGTGSRPAVRSTPAAIASHTFTQISAGATHACALDSSGKTYCWGNGVYNEGTQLGLGTYWFIQHGGSYLATPALLPSTANCPSGQIYDGSTLGCMTP
jgi:alpha-tubulin suppressor-like RCC1 family protein